MVLINTFRPAPPSKLNRRWTFLVGVWCLRMTATGKCGGGCSGSGGLVPAGEALALLEWIRGKQWRASKGRDPPHRELSRRKRLCSEKRKRVMGRGNPGLTEAGGKTLTQLVISHGPSGEVAFPAVGWSWFPSSLALVYDRGRSQHWHAPGPAVTPHSGLPGCAHCKALRWTLAWGATGG